MACLQNYAEYLYPLQPISLKEPTRLIEEVSKLLEAYMQAILNSDS